MKKENKTYIQDEQMIKSIIESKLEDNYYITEDFPSYSLKECLKKINKNLLDFIYINYFMLTGNGKMPNEKLNDNEKIEFLSIYLPKRFEGRFDSILGGDMGVFKDVLDNKVTNIYNEMFLTNGFMFGFRKEEKTVYIVPEEYLKIYKNNFSEEKSWLAVKQNVTNYLQGYMLINGIIPRKVLFDFITKRHKLNINIDELDKLAKERGIKIYRDYYSLLYDDVVNLKLLIKAKEKLSYYYLDGCKLISYLDFFQSFSSKLTKILKDNNRVNLVLSVILTSFLSFDETLKELKLNKNEKSQLEDLLDVSWYRLRFWVLNGRTTLAFKNELMWEKFLLKEKPKKETLEYCLNSLSDNQYKELINLYELKSGTSILEFAKLIINNFKLNILSYNERYFQFLLASNHKILKDNSLEYYDMTQGYIFIYKENNENKIIIPKEILDILINNIEK